MADDKPLDLDALAPKTKKVKLDGKEIEVKPPTTGQIIKVSSFGARLKGFGDLSAEEGDALEADITGLLKELAPELPTDLAFVQKVAVLNMVSQMSMPPEAKELEKKGITANTPKDNPSA